MALLSPISSISLSQRRWACVLDPSLFLSRYGLLLVQSLGEILELWVARELWHILDNPDYYFTQPEFVLPQTGLAQSLEHQLITQQTKIRVLKQWELVRTKTPPTNLNLFWFGDKPGESFLPDGTDPRLIKAWEELARSLETRSQPQPVLNTMLIPAFRDTAALAAVLGSAFILTYQPLDNSLENGNRSRPPDICLVLEQWGIACQQIDPLDAIVAIERENLLQLIISTGLSKFLWAGLHLVVLHLVVLSAFTSYHNTQHPWIEYSSDEASDSEISPSTTDVWEEAQGFWYYL